MSFLMGLSINKEAIDRGGGNGLILASLDTSIISPKN